MTERMKNLMNEREAEERDGAMEGARRATGSAASLVPPPDPEVAATAKRRQFSGSERRRILAAADRCTESGEIGALLRREGIYSSQLATWRKQRAAMERAALEPKQRGRKADPAIAEARRMDELTRENGRLRHKLAQAHTIINTSVRPLSPIMATGCLSWLGTCKGGRCLALANLNHDGLRWLPVLSPINFKIS